MKCARISIDSAQFTLSVMHDQTYNSNEVTNSVLRVTSLL